ncbi:hypothetical protein [Saccharopolyspora sp. 5N708]
MNDDFALLAQVSLSGAGGPQNPGAGGSQNPGVGGPQNAEENQ